MKASCAKKRNPDNRGRYNKSLDASGTSGLVIDNLSVTPLSPAASTQSLSGAQRVGGQRAAAAPLT
jgi:hypothetical protein